MTHSLLASRRLMQALCALTFMFSGTASAWVYPEHREIAVLAVGKLDEARQAELDTLWARVRAGHEKRLNAKAADPDQGEKPTSLDWAAWPGIAGDHSCSAADMANTVFNEDWIIDVAGIAAKLNKELAAVNEEARRIPPPKSFAADLRRQLDSENIRSRRVNALRNSDIQYQRVDMQYATRSGANNVHFLLARPRGDVTGTEYVRICLTEGSELNAIGAYAWYHLSALEKASKLARGNLNAREQADLSLAVLADEAFAIHFLEDSFAAGHVAGTWGNASQRKGTHDYYNENGLETIPWKWEGRSYILMGDSYMRPEDAARAADSVRRSLEQILDVAGGRGPALSSTTDVPHAPDPFNVCRESVIPRRVPAPPPAVFPLFVDILKDLPVPELGPGVGSLPRFRSELGPFIGLSAGIFAKGINGGFAQSQKSGGFNGGLEGALRLGLGLDGVMNEAGDGLLFLDLGIRQETASSMEITNNPSVARYGSIGAAIPARTAVTARLRMPFWLIPGDLILGLPVMAISKDQYMKMVVGAGNGGLIPWQSGIATSIGRFQFVLGREVGVSFYGHWDDDRIIIPSGTPGGTATLISYRSTAYDFPILEYRPMRNFSQDQSSSILMQIYSGFEVPETETVIDPPGAAAPSLKTVGHAGFRFIFNWRSYL